MKSSKTINSILNAITMILNTLVISFLGLVSTNLIIKNYGSDFNGVVATANQVVNLLLIVEGGFTTAINVALFKPYVDNDIKKINKIMSTAKRAFIKIGLTFLIIGLVVSLVYPLFIKSDIDYITIFLIFLMVIIGTSYNLFFTIKSQIMFQVSQKEYIYTTLAIIINILSNVATIILAYNAVNMLLIRFFILMFVIINGVILFIIYKKNYSYIQTNEKPNYKLIKGTKDIIIQKLTSVVYLSSPLLFISTFVSTKLASVYVVYNSIYNIIRNFLNSIISAPVNGFGQLLSNNEKKNIYHKFELYEYIIILLITILISTTLSLIMPFVDLYTRSIKEIDYSNITIAIMLAIIVVLELVHIPSGNIINVTGNFKISRKIQTIACAMLVILLFALGLSFKLYGILMATIITNIVLAYLEISYVHNKIFNSNIKRFLILFFSNVILMIMSILFINVIGLNINSYLDFIIYGIIILLYNAFITLGFNYLFFKKLLRNLFDIIINLVNKKLSR